MHELDPHRRDVRALASPIVFEDRRDAGRRLASLLTPLVGSGPVVLGLPRGGVPVAAEVARALHAPLDVILVRKLGVPFQPELAMGALGEGGVRVINEDVRRAAGVTDRDLFEVEARERVALERMTRSFRGGRRPAEVRHRTVVVVDDGIATGSTARAACQVTRAHGATRVVLAAPVIPGATLLSLRPVADDVVCVQSPEPFFAIGQWYRDFTQTNDEEVTRLLDEAAERVATRSVSVSIDPRTGATLPGELSVPSGATGVVVFAHGSGSSRSSPRNLAVARQLHAASLGTLVFDLLTPREAQDRTKVFDVPLLASRLELATRSVERLQPDLQIGYFGASTGAAAALSAASEPGSSVAAVVARGGRPDLAGRRLREVRSPTLLVVGGRDPEVLALNRRALDAMRCERRLVVVENATHLFEEPGALDRVADLAAEWFSSHFSSLPGHP